MGVAGDCVVLDVVVLNIFRSRYNTYGSLFATRLVTESGGLATNPPCDKTTVLYTEARDKGMKQRARDKGM